MESTIGKNIREIRKIRKLTIAELADRISELGGDSVSGGLVGAWERGERKIFAYQIPFIAEALGITITELYGSKPKSENVEAILQDLFQDIHDLGPEEIEILYNVARVFNGNKYPLIHLVGMYVSLNRKERAEIAMMGIHMYEKGIREGSISPDAPRVNLDLIEREWRKLLLYLYQ